MRQLQLSLWSIFIFSSFSSCISFVEDPDEENLVDVAYLVPIYETVQQLADKISIEPPSDYTQSGKIITYGDYIFVNKPEEGIHVVDNSNPNATENLHFISIPGSIDMAIIDNYLYADMYSALVVFNLSDIDNPELIKDFTVEDVFYYNPYETIPEGQWNQNYDYSNYEEVDSSRGIVTSWDIEIRKEPEDQLKLLVQDYAILDDSVLTANFAEVSAEVSTAGSMARFLPVENFLYAINLNELILFSIEENYKPTRFARLDTQTQAETLFLLNDYLFVGSTTGMLMYDVTSPDNPSFLNKIEHFRSCDPVVADSSYAYVTLRGGTFCFTDLNELQIIDIRDPKELVVTARQVLFNPHGLAIYQDYLIVCDGSAGLKVIDVEDRENPQIVSTEEVPFAYDIIIDYPEALVVGEGVLYQYDLSNLPEINKTSELLLSAN